MEDKEPVSPGRRKGTGFDRIPLIDIAPLFGADAAGKATVARAIAGAASEVGFFYITGHGVPAPALQRLQAQAASFFALPLAIKQKYYIGRSRAHRGYVPVGEEIFSYDGAAKIDKKEGFDLSIELPEEDPDHLIGYRMLGPNQWPQELSGFRQEVYGYYQAAIALGRVLFRGFALALDLEEGYFERSLTKPPSQLRLLHYPAEAAPSADAPSDWGISSHTDYECFTILYGTTAGLEILNAENRWIDAPPVPGAFVINIGDMMEVLTNGRFIATPHRVRNVPQERFSFPLFCALDYDTVIEPLPHCRRRGEPALYPSYVAGDHLFAQTLQTFGYLRRLRDAGRVALPASEAAQDVAFGRKEPTSP